MRFVQSNLTLTPVDVFYLSFNVVVIMLLYLSIIMWSQNAVSLLISYLSTFPSGDRGGCDL